jgi:centrosomal protein CEP104
MSSDFCWIGYTPIAASSEAAGTSLQELANTETGSAKSWESGRFVKYPQEVVIRLDHRVELAHVLIASKPDRIIPDIEICVGDGLYGSFVDADYRFAGKGELIATQRKQVPVMGIGSFLKFIFNKAPSKTTSNPCCQIGISMLKVWARKLTYDTQVNSFDPVPSHTDNVDRVLVSLGVPLDPLMWSREDRNSYKFAPVDEDSRETLLELEERLNQAYQDEDYGALKMLNGDIRLVFSIGTEILAIKRELAVAVSQEDFEKARELKLKMLALEKQRDEIDALYETKRYERMIRLGKPSDAHIAFVNQLLEEERLRLERLRKQREEEMERHRRYLEELERKRREAELANRKQSSSPPKKKAGPVKVVASDPYEYNEGDGDLEPYLRPRIAEAGGQVKIVDIETLRRADQRRVLRVCGVRFWSAIFGDNWRHREAAIRALFEFMEAPLLPKYVNDTRPLFRAAIESAQLACEDKVLSVYLHGLKVLITAMEPPICDGKVTPKMVNDAVKVFIPVLLTKISELNYRARDISMHTLIELFRQPNVKVGPLVEYMMSVTAPGEKPVEKQPWRIILPRLEILLHIVQEFGVDAKEWNWKEVFHMLVTPCFSHANADIRMACVELTAALYSKIGMELRLEVENLGTKLKPQLGKIIYEKMLNIDQNPEPTMEAIQETQEWTEHTPPGTARRESKWAKLKSMISEAVVEEEAKNRHRS